MRQVTRVSRDVHVIQSGADVLGDEHLSETLDALVTQHGVHRLTCCVGVRGLLGVRALDHATRQRQALAWNKRSLLL